MLGKKHFLPKILAERKFFAFSKHVGSSRNVLDLIHAAEKVVRQSAEVVELWNYQFSGKGSQHFKIRWTKHEAINFFGTMWRGVRSSFSMKVKPLGTMSNEILVLFKKYSVDVIKSAKKMKWKNIGAKYFALDLQRLKDAPKTYVARV